ncbi:MAG: ATP synthase subunit I [Christensenellaceae bacterium]|nr:ATP synthase subunit I [Christensenellaceae bacterium]
MLKSDPIVRKETLRIIVGELALSAVMQLVFLLLGFWNITVLYGNLLGAFAAVLNFYLMCLTVLKAVSLEPDKAKQHIRTSQMLRMLMLLGFALVGVLLGCFNTIASLVPLFFPRIVITFYQLTHRGETDEQTDSAGTEVPEDER